MDRLHAHQEAAALALESCRTPPPARKPDAEIDPHAGERQRLAETIMARIRAEAHGGTRHLEVQVQESMVRLRGHCSSYYCKQLAQHAALAAIAETTAGVFADDVEVVNEIHVW